MIRDIKCYYCNISLCGVGALWWHVALRHFTYCQYSSWVRKRLPGEASLACPWCFEVLPYERECSLDAHHLTCSRRMLLQLAGRIT